MCRNGSDRCAAACVRISPARLAPPGAVPSTPTTSARLRVFGDSSNSNSTRTGDALSGCPRWMNDPHPPRRNRGPASRRAAPPPRAGAPGRAGPPRARYILRGATFPRGATPAARGGRRPAPAEIREQERCVPSRAVPGVVGNPPGFGGACWLSCVRCQHPNGGRGCVNRGPRAPPQKKEHLILRDPQTIIEQPFHSKDTVNWRDDDTWRPGKSVCLTLPGTEGWNLGGPGHLCA